MNGYQKYKEQSIYSMSGVERLLLLYDEAVKQLKKAEYALDDKDYGVFDNSISRTVKIVRYLNSILNMDVPISWDFRRVYEYIFQNLGLIRAGRERRRDEIGEIIHLLTEFHDGFEEAGKQVPREHMSSVKRIVG